MDNDFSDLTIKDIEEIEHVEYDGITEEYALPIWYDKVCLKRLFELTDGDIAKFIRQKIFLNYIIPEAISRIKVDPFCGDKYDGEVMFSLSGLEKEFWDKNILLAQQTKK